MLFRSVSQSRYLVGDEAHYWECGRFLDWSHYGKGPGAALVIWLFTFLLGDAVWVVRLPAVLLAAGTGWLIFLLGRTFYNDRVGLVAVAAASVMPLFAVGSILMTIDPLSVFFWATAALTFWKAVEQPDRFGLTANQVVRACGRVAANRLTAKQKGKKVKNFAPTSFDCDARTFRF